MKKSVFSTFVCDPEIILKWLQHHGNLQWIPPQKTLWSTFFSRKKKIPSDIPKWSFFDFKTETESPFGNRKFFPQNLTYSYSFSGWNSPGITMYLESLDNFFGITVKSRKNDENFSCFELWLWSRNNVEMIDTLRESPVNFIHKNTMVNFFFHKKKKFCSTSLNGGFPILRPNLRLLSGIENFFSQNLACWYSFLAWNLPGITMFSESLNNYFRITVKSRKNNEKFGFFEFWLWHRNNDEMIATSR